MSVKKKTIDKTKKHKHLTVKQRRDKRKKINSIIWGSTFAIIIVILGFILFFNQQATSVVDQISVNEAFQKYQAGALLLDVRTQEEWITSHIPNSIWIPLEELQGRLDELPRDNEIVVVCRTGNRSQTGGKILHEAGFVQVSSMKGGIKGWIAAGYPVVSDQ